MQKYLIVTLSLTLLAIIVGCSPAPETEGIKGTLNNEGKPVTVRVYVYDTDSALNKAYEKSGLKQTPHSAAGWSGWSVDGTYCEIHVRKATSPNSSHFSTWGHELAHCTYGSYHPEG